MKKFNFNNLSDFENEAIDVSDREFNSQNLFFLRVHKLMQYRDEVAIKLDVLNYALAILVLFKDVYPKLIKENIKEAPEINIKTKELFDKVITNQRINQNNKAEKLNNDLLIFKELYTTDSLLEYAIHRAGIIYPKHKTLEIEEIAERDY